MGHISIIFDPNHNLVEERVVFELVEIAEEGKFGNCGVKNFDRLGIKFPICQKIFTFVP